MAIMMPDERTLADIRMEALRNQTKLSIVSPRLEPNIAGTDVGAAQAKHNMNMLVAKAPTMAVSVVEATNIPTSMKNLYASMFYMLQAPELMLTRAKESPGQELTTAMLNAKLEKIALNVKVLTPSYYRKNPQLVVLRDIYGLIGKVVVNRNVETESDPNERTKQWLTKNVQAVQQSFEEVRPRAAAVQQKGGFIKWPFGRKK